MPWGWRVVTTTLLLVVAVSLAYLPLVMITVAGTLELGGLVEFLGAAVVGASRAFVLWLSMWQSVAEFNGVFAKVISTPQVASALVAIAALSLTALLTLSRLIASYRSARHV